MEELISVVVPIYNVENFLEKCVDSILSQTYSNLEIILINDGSQDNCLKICRNYELKDSRIIVIDKKNGGLSSARNAGIDKATGKYIMFIDSDDYIEKNMVEKLYNNISLNDADISICNFFFTYKNENKRNKAILNTTIDDESKFSYLYGKYSLQTIISWNKLYKKELFNEIRYPDGLIHEDQYIICDLLDKSKKINYMTDEFLYYYVQRDNSIMSTFNINRFDVIKGLNRRIEFFESKKYNMLINRTKVEKIQLLYQLLKESKKSTVEDKNKDIIKAEEIDFKNTCCELKGAKIDVKSKIKLILIEKLPNIYDFLKREKKNEGNSKKNFKF